LSVIFSKNNIQRLFSLGTILKTAGTYQDTNNQTSHKDKYSLDDETHVNLTRELILTSAVYFYLLGTAGDGHGTHSSDVQNWFVSFPQVLGSLGANSLLVQLRSICQQLESTTDWRQRTVPLCSGFLQYNNDDIQKTSLTNGKMFFLLPGGEKAQGLHPGHGACVLSPVPGHAGQDAVGAAAYSCLNPSTKKQ
jgi:hypothetical protein